MALEELHIIFSASVAAEDNNSSWDTTCETRPTFKASSAVTILQLKIISVARPLPISWASRWVPP